jgi:hypothetical protein
MTTWRPFTLIVFFLLMMVAVGAFQTQGSEPLKSLEQRSIYRNEYGDIVRDSKGQQINYSIEELRAKSDGLPARASTSPLANSSAPELVWNYAAFGNRLGESNIIAARNGAQLEIYLGGSTLTFGSNNYWYTLRYDASTQEYQQIYASPLMPNIRRIEVGNVTGDSADEIIVLREFGQVHVYNQATKQQIRTIAVPSNGLAGLAIADLDGNGVKEIIISTHSFSSDPPRLFVYSGDGALKWDLAGVGGWDADAGQMDTDPAIEIAVSGGKVVDGTTRTVQWSWPNVDGHILEAVDIDGDNMKEVITTGYSTYVKVYDVDSQTLKWSLPNEGNTGGFQVADIDGDSVQELIIGNAQWGDIKAYDTQTRLVEWTVPNTEHSVQDIAVGDFDADGANELMWATGGGNTGPDFLHVVNWQTKQLEWRSIHLDGPFVSPQIGDLDDDGVNELVVVSRESNSGYGSGRILVFDALTRRLRAISNEVVGGTSWTGVRDLKLRDMDSDGQLEILITADRYYDGALEIYRFNPAGSLSVIWSTTTNTIDEGSINAAEAVDLDNDGDVEIIAADSSIHTSDFVMQVHVYDYATGVEEWRSPEIPGGGFSSLEVANIDQDSAKEIIGLHSYRGVYIIDGTSRLIEATLPGEFTDMGIHRINNALQIALSNEDGELLFYRYSSGTFSQTYRNRLTTRPIGAFTIDSENRIWVSNGGDLDQFNFAGRRNRTISGYGEAFGRRVVSLPGSPLIFTTTSYSVAAFFVGTGNDGPSICLQDDVTGDLLRLNLNTGEYLFTASQTGYMLGGIGAVTKRGSTITIQHNTADRRVLAQIDQSTHKGNASIQAFAQGIAAIIRDRDTTNNRCE